MLTNVLNGKYEVSPKMELQHPDNSDIKDNIYEIYDLPKDIDFDTFNNRFGGMTRKEYLNYLYKK